MGDDAAGRGMATGFAVLLSPVVLLAGALLYWGQRAGNRYAFGAGFAIVALPLAYAAYQLATGMAGKASRAMGRRLYGLYDDGRLTKLARAISGNDLDEVRRLAAVPGLDFTARDRRGRTILGHAVTHVLSDTGGRRSVESVRILLAAGARPVENAIAPERTSAEPEGHLLLASAFGGNSPGVPELLDVLLSAGLDPDGVDMDGRPLIFSTYASRAKLEVLAKHGANLKALDPRTDQPGWTALMVAASMTSWDEALFFLEHGVPPEHVAPDGASLASILAEDSSNGADDPKRQAFLDALAKHGRSGK